MGLWHLRRLRAMSWDERRLRVRRRLRDRRDRATFARNDAEAVAGPAPASKPFLETWTTTPWLLDPGDLAARAPSTPAVWRTRTLTEAGEILRGEYRWLGEVRLLGQRPDWLQDSVSRAGFPLRHWSLFPTAAADGVFDLKHVWEPNLHPAFVTLAKAFLLTGEDRYRDHLRVLWADWMAQNLPLAGPNYLAPIEIGLRLVHWGTALRFWQAREAVPETLLKVIWRHVHFQRHTIAENLSLHSSANNHLLGELLTLVVTDHAFPGIAPPEETRAHEEWLRREILTQFHEDGGNREQAFHYHAFALALGLLGAQLGSRRGEPWPEAVLERLRAAARFLAAGLDRAGRPFLFGDSDESEVLPLAEGSRDLYRPLLAQAHVLLGVPGGLGPEGDERAWWLCGAAALPDSGRASLPAPESACFPHSGHAFLRAGETEVHFNAGELGFLSIAAHGHADALSVQVRHRGQPIIVDPGTHSYRGGNPWREALVSTAMHPTVTVDGSSQAERLGPFLWGARPRVTLTPENAPVPPHAPGRAETPGDAGGVGAARRPGGTLNAGTPRASGRIEDLFGSTATWSRTVEVHTGEIVVTDRLEGPGTHQVRLTWPLAPGKAEAIPGGARWTAGRLEATLILEGLAGEPRLERGDPDRAGSPCVSPAYDRLEPAWALVHEAEVISPRVWITRIRLSPNR